VFSQPAKIPHCITCNGLIKPDIVYFGESLPSRFFQLAQEDFPQCDLLLVIGTSLKVYPFASLTGMPNPLVPRLLINREAVGVYDPVHHMLGVRGASSGFLFKHPQNYRDVFLPGSIEDSIRQFVKLLGWEDELNALMSKQPEVQHTPVLHFGGSPPSTPEQLDQKQPQPTPLPAAASVPTSAPAPAPTTVTAPTTAPAPKTATETSPAQAATPVAAADKKDDSSSAAPLELSSKSQQQDSVASKY